MLHEHCQHIYHIYYTQTFPVINWLTCSALFLPWAYILAQSVHFYLQQNHTVRKLHKSMRMPSWSHVLLMHVIFQPVKNKIFKIIKNCKSTIILSKFTVAFISFVGLTCKSSCAWTFGGTYIEFAVVLAEVNAARALGKLLSAWYTWLSNSWT